MASGNGQNGGHQQEAVNTDIITLTRFLTEEQTKHKEATGDFTYGLASYCRVWTRLTDMTRLLCHALQFAFKSIAYYIRRATLINVRDPTLILKLQQLTNIPSSPASKAPPTPPATTKRNST